MCVLNFKYLTTLGYCSHREVFLRINLVSNSWSCKMFRRQVTWLQTQCIQNRSYILFFVKMKKLTDSLQITSPLIHHLCCVHFELLTVRLKPVNWSAPTSQTFAHRERHCEAVRSSANSFQLTPRFLPYISQCFASTRLSI